MTQKEIDELLNYALIANNQLSLVICSYLRTEEKLKYYKNVIFELTKSIIKIAEKRPQVQLWSKP